VDNNGAYDYAADTRGYTFGALLEYYDRNWALRFAEGLMPKVANGIHLDADVNRAHSENVELELRGRVIGKRPGIVRALSYVNHANMGDYADAVNSWLANPGDARARDYRAPAANHDQVWVWIELRTTRDGLARGIRRWGWNEGQHETFAFTEVDQTWQIGVGGNGGRWGRRNDHVGLAFASNGISRDHAQYLAHGGTDLFWAMES